MDKNKIIEAANKYVAKGAYDKAIKELQRVVDADPRDIRVLQKMGELHQKKGDNAKAAFYFTKVGESYATDGFFLKAVALYKQVLKLDPSLMHLNIRLAELHQQLQLMGEAMAYYQVMANHHEKVGDNKALLDVLRKMLELDPDNVPSRVKLAELFVREKQTKEAIAELRRAAEHLKRNNRIDDYVRVAERIFALEPENLVLARELSEIYLSRNDAKRALVKLQVCFKQDAKNVDILKMLAQAFHELGQTAKTVSVYKELTKIYEQRGQGADADRVWRQIESLDPADADAASRKTQTVMVKAPAAGRAPSPTGSFAAPALNQATVVATSSPVDSASTAATQVERPIPVPQSERFQPAAPAPSAQHSSAVTAGPDTGLTRDKLSRILTETDVYLKYGLHDKALEHLRKIFLAEPENILAHEKAYQIYVGSGNRHQALEQLLNVLRLHARAQDALRAKPYLDALIAENPNHPELGAFLSALGLQETPSEEAVVLEPESGAIDVVSEEAMVADDVVEASGSVEVVTEEDEEWLEEPSGVILLDSVDESATRVALPAQNLPRPAASPAPMPVAPQRAPAKPAPVAKAEDDFSFDDEPQAEAPVQLDDESGAAAEELSEAEFYLSQGQQAEAREVLDNVLLAFPGHPRALELVAQLEASAGSAAGSEDKGAFDLAAELAAEFDDAPQASAPEAGAAEDDFQYSVEEVFSEFKRGLEKVVKPEDVETHYDLGIAYKEMGLVDDAIREFDIARQGCRGKRKELDCLTMAGMLLVQKQDYARAVQAFREALGSELATGETERALRYELALAHEAAGSLGKALGHYLKVAAVDAGYRDVRAAVARLKARARPEDELPLRARPSAAPPPRKIAL